MRVLTLGRDATNDIQFADDPYITRSCHCQLIQEDDGTYTVVDFSSNGTFVNNNKIPGRVHIKLKEYDVLQIGSSDALPWKSYFKKKTEEFKEEREFKTTGDAPNKQSGKKSFWKWLFG